MYFYSIVLWPNGPRSLHRGYLAILTFIHNNHRFRPHHAATLTNGSSTCAREPVRRDDGLGARSTVVLTTAVTNSNPNAETTDTTVAPKNAKKRQSD